MIKSIWVDIKDRLPEDQGYYEVRFADGTEDEKWFRVRASKGIKGFMTKDEVTHWKETVHLQKDLREIELEIEIEKEMD